MLRLLCDMTPSDIRSKWNYHNYEYLQSDSNLGNEARFPAADKLLVNYASSY